MLDSLVVYLLVTAFDPIRDWQVGHIVPIGPAVAGSAR